MPKLTTAQLDKAAHLFLSENPAAMRRITFLTQADADFMDTSLDQLRLEKTMEEIKKFAEATGRDYLETLFSYAANDAEEYEKMCEERRQGTKKALGL